MILSDRDIRTEIEAGHIVIDPFDEACIQPSSVDLHVDRVHPNVVHLNLLPKAALSPFAPRK